LAIVAADYLVKFAIVADVNKYAYTAMKRYGHAVAI
jgi:hypothetical protein